MAVRKKTAVTSYLSALPPERRAVVAAVRDAIVRHLPPGYEETVTLGMLSYEVPLKRYPDTYNRQPLPYACLAAQKRHYALYLMGAYADANVAKRIAAGFKARGKKLDMGKSCLRFKTLDDLPLDVIGEAIASTPVDRMIELARKSRR